MEIIERREDGALVQLVADTADATFYITDIEGTHSVHLEKGQSAKVMVAYNGTITVKYSKGNTDTLIVGAATVEAIRKATTRRFPNIKVGL